MGKGQVRAADFLLEPDIVSANRNSGGGNVGGLVGGLIGGRAPLCDRYILGNSVLLRGWNKYDLDPAGGNRMIYNSVEYRYGPFQTFYDTCAIWDQGQTAIARHSLGVGIRESVFSLAVAFPVRGGHVEPVFMMGLLY